MSQIDQIITHSGKFHADDVFAVGVLRTLFPGASFERTRDPHRIAIALDTPDAAVVDVGGKYDPERGAFDHHQCDFDRKRPGGGPYASFGLVWGTHGRTLVATRFAGRPDDWIARMVEVFDETFVASVDAADCGAANWRVPIMGGAGHLDPVTVSQLVDHFNPTATAESNDATCCEAFDRAQIWAMSVIDRALAACRSIVDAQPVVAGADDGSFVLVLPNPVPWERWVGQHHRYVVYPAAADDWRTQCVSTPRNPMEPIEPFPVAWRGLRSTPPPNSPDGPTLPQVTGVADAVFCHRAGFIAGAVSREGALALARQAHGHAARPSVDEAN